MRAEITLCLSRSISLPPAIHGYSEEKIRSFEPESVQAKKIAAYFDRCRFLQSGSGVKDERMIIAGYNVGFDVKHLTALMERNGFDMDTYFTGQIADVYEQVKQAGIRKVLPYLPNRKLTTVAKHLGIELENAHDALADITATRGVALKLHKMGVKLEIGG
ncbi:MAG: 3'-5' exonuclease [Treponema sp.]